MSQRASRERRTLAAGICLTYTVQLGSSCRGLLGVVSVPQGIKGDCKENQCLFRDSKLKVKWGRKKSVAQPKNRSEKLNELHCIAFHPLVFLICRSHVLYLEIITYSMNGRRGKSMLPPRAPSMLLHHDWTIEYIRKVYK